MAGQGCLLPRHTEERDAGVVGARGLRVETDRCGTGPAGLKKGGQLGGLTPIGHGTLRGPMGEPQGLQEKAAGWLSMMPWARPLPPPLFHNFSKSLTFGVLDSKASHSPVGE